MGKTNKDRGATWRCDCDACGPTPPLEVDPKEELLNDYGMTPYEVKIPCASYKVCWGCYHAVDWYKDPPPVFKGLEEPGFVNAPRVRTTK